MVNRDIEDAIYDQIAAELANNDIQSGLMAKAAAKAKGDNNVAKSLYIELRAEQLARHLKRAAREHQRTRNRPRLPTPSPDTPLHTFTIKGPGGIFGIRYRLTIRQNTVLIASRKKNDDIVLDPSQGSYGVRFSGWKDFGYYMTLLNHQGDEMRFTMDSGAFKTVKSWWKKRNRR